MKVVNLSRFFKYKLYIIISLAILIGSILILVAMKTIFNVNINYLKGPNTIFNMQNYYAEFLLTVKSNKTINSYYIRQWYVKRTRRRKK